MTTTVRWNPGGAYWAAVLLGLPAASGAILWALSKLQPLADASTAAEIVTLAVLAGAAALALWRLPRLRSMTPRARAAWALAGTALAFLATNAWVVGLFIGFLFFACRDGGCFG